MLKESKLLAIITVRHCCTGICHRHRHHSFIHSFYYLFIHSFIHSFIHLLDHHYHLIITTFIIYIVNIINIIVSIILFSQQRHHHHHHHHHHNHHHRSSSSFTNGNPNYAPYSASKSPITLMLKGALHCNQAPDNAKRYSVPFTATKSRIMLSATVRLALQPSPG